MARKRKRAPVRKRVGQVSYFHHHGGWYIYYRDGRKQVRRRIGTSEAEAVAAAAQINAQLASSAPTFFSFQGITVPELRQQFLDHYEYTLRSSVGTVNRYQNSLAQGESVPLGRL